MRRPPRTPPVTASQSCEVLKCLVRQKPKSLSPRDIADLLPGFDEETVRRCLNALVRDRLASRYGGFNWYSPTVFGSAMIERMGGGGGVNP